MRIRFKNGVEVEGRETRVLFDPLKTEPNVTAFITHAHSDHVPKDVSRPKGRVLTSRGTANIIRRRYNGRVEVIQLGKEYRIGEFLVRAYPVGHIYGSVGYLIQGKEATVFYTGDVNPGGALTAEDPEIPEVDVLIVESTYGLPRYRFPDQLRVRADLARWAAQRIKQGKNAVIEAYVVGKSQEVIATLNWLTNLEVVVSPKVAEVAKAYEGVKLEFSEVRPKGPHVYVTGRANGDKVVVSGWVVDHGGGFPLSSHADFDGLLDVVVKSGARKILTVYGFSRYFAEWLKNRGKDAEFLRESWLIV